MKIQKATFPIIAKIIEHLHRREPTKFVPRLKIAESLLRDNRSLVRAAYERTARKKSIKEYAGNMVDFFSSTWTMCDPQWERLFRKFRRSEKKIGGYWAYRPVSPSAVIAFPDDVVGDGKGLPEGAAFQRLVNGYERSNLARQKCIDKYGAKCYICGFSFGVAYGQAVDGLIHVHHLIQLSKVGKGYEVDPIADLRPVCPNCHAVIHHPPGRPYTIEEVQAFLRKASSKP